MGTIAAIIIGGCVIFSIILWGNFFSERSKEKEQRRQMLENALNNWNQRVNELGFSPAGKSIVYCKYGNSDSFYPVHIWVENGLLWEFVARPTEETCGDSMYTYPENIKKVHFGNIRRIYRTGSQGQYTERDFSHANGMRAMADMSASSIERAYYSKKALDATISAPSYTVKYDTRMTIVEADNGPFKYSVDSYDVFKRLVPDKC